MAAEWTTIASLATSAGTMVLAPRGSVRNGDGHGFVVELG